MEKISCTVPYLTAYSKNKKYYGHMVGKYRVITNEYRKASVELLRIFNNSFRGHALKDKTKTWVRIYAYRPDLKSDIQNFEECICDALKSAIAIDDRYYALVIDWELVTENPRILIEIWQ